MNFCYIVFPVFNYLIGTDSFIFFFNDTATTEIYTLSLHDALPICSRADHRTTTAGGSPRFGSPAARVREPAHKVRNDRRTAAAVRLPRDSWCPPARIAPPRRRKRRHARP